MLSITPTGRDVRLKYERKLISSNDSVRDSKIGTVAVKNRASLLELLTMVPRRDEVKRRFVIAVQSF